MRLRSILSIAMITLAMTTVESIRQAQAEGISLFVAPDGTAGNPGTKEQPFATLEQARGGVAGAVGAALVAVALARAAPPSDMPPSTQTATAA